MTAVLMTTVTTTTCGRPITSPAVLPSNLGLAPVPMLFIPTIYGSTSPPTFVAALPPCPRTLPLVRPSGTSLETIPETPAAPSSCQGRARRRHAEMTSPWSFVASAPEERRTAAGPLSSIDNKGRPNSSNGSVSAMGLPQAKRVRMR